MYCRSRSRSCPRQYLGQHPTAVSHRSRSLHIRCQQRSPQSRRSTWRRWYWPKPQPHPQPGRLPHPQPRHPQWTTPHSCNTRCRSSSPWSGDGTRRNRLRRSRPSCHDGRPIGHRAIARGVIGGRAVRVCRTPGALTARRMAAALLHESVYKQVVSLTLGVTPLIGNSRASPAGSCDSTPWLAETVRSPVAQNCVTTASRQRSS